MNVGRDIIGTMANTLILAHAGGSINLLLLIVAEDLSLYQLINRETIASEVLRSPAGSLGLIITVPVTAIVDGLLVKKSKVLSTTQETILTECALPKQTRKNVPGG